MAAILPENLDLGERESPVQGAAVARSATAGGLYPLSYRLGGFARASMKVLVTGGAGDIRAHTCVQLVQAGHDGALFAHLFNNPPPGVGRAARIDRPAP